jgi:hypothetical protein
VTETNQPPTFDLATLRAIGEDRDLLGPARFDPISASYAGFLGLVVLTSRIEWWEVHCLAITFQASRGGDPDDTESLFDELADNPTPDEFPNTEFGQYVREVGRIPPYTAYSASRTMQRVLGAWGLHDAAKVTPNYLECWRRFRPNQERIRECCRGRT